MSPKSARDRLNAVVPEFAILLEVIANCDVAEFSPVSDV
jgi:hypothetical protein